MTRTNLTAAQTDRACGVLLGAAAGDALGAGYEFGSAPVVGRPRMIGGGLGGFAPGEWTDDTAQTYAIARVAAAGADLRTDEALDAIASGFAEWYAASPPDVGIQTGQVLRTVGPQGTAAEMTATAAALHARTGKTAGNGALMRTAPVALAYLDDPEALVDAASRIAALTHTDLLAPEASALWCLGIRRTVLEGEIVDLREELSYLRPDRAELWRDIIDQAEQEQPGRFRPNGFVVSALQAAWSAIVHTAQVEHRPSEGRFSSAHLVAALETAIEIGDDTDTVASIAGAMLGGRWGASAVPAAWRRILHGWPGTSGEELANLALLIVRRGRTDSAGWPGVDAIDYSGWGGVESAVPHPYDEQVLLSGAVPLDDLPDEVTAVVSLCRLGRAQVPERIEHRAAFRLIDTDARDNPNLEYVIDDAARTVLDLRDEGHTVLLHCVAGQSRTPTVAARYAALLGYGTERALEDVCAVLPGAMPRPALVAALRSLG
ncbi:ADP-ribosylglycohydrolase [Mumia flava]|uniref:ADP-ribosylglycohydrolase n=1 Tax=Mumia flava TaxID=1348852 RepID=A0A0B2BSF7_9ACTN|nr:ADP-ribosylglycohydrolase family protein [Mumia flava]PJJ53757.1 ADP-ribosylglycohydrolase [Mumia flava]